MSKFNLKLKPIPNSGDTCVILGNGPSLNDSLKENFDFINKYPKVCVNYFCKSDYYEKLKPSIYVLNAPEHFAEVAPTKLHNDAREEMFNLIGSKTTWPLKLVIPASTKKYPFWHDKIAKNKNITVDYFNQTPVEGLQFFCNWVFKNNLGVPRPHNVLIPSLVIALNLNFKKLYLFGADHSWHEQWVLNKDGDFEMGHVHFYDTKGYFAKSVNMDGGKKLFHELLYKFYLTFKGYFIIKDYAQNRNAAIYNASKKSYIDAFEKIKV